jgi:hypothetical protein
MISEFLTEIVASPYFALSGPIIGFLLGNWFHIWRDRRNEFNAAAEKLASIINSGKHPIPREAFSEFRRFLPAWKRSGYDALTAKYCEIIVRPLDYVMISRSPELSGMIPTGHKEAERIAASIYTFTKRA